MKYLEIPMHLPDYREGDYEPKLYAYLLDPIKDYRPAPRPAVLICPGGAYAYTSDREAEPLALYFLAAGIPTFVLRYSVAEVSDAKFPTSLREVSLAMAYIRAHGGEWAIDPQRVFVCGSSAGGHLAASLGVHWDKELVWKGAGIPFGENRPAGTILMYPVISSGEKQHVGSFHNLMGETETPELREFLSLEKQVSGNTPPAFLWHTFEDPPCRWRTRCSMPPRWQSTISPLSCTSIPEGATGWPWPTSSPAWGTQRWWCRSARSGWQMPSGG